MQTVGIHIEKFYVALWHWIINAKICDAPDIKNNASNFVNDHNFVKGKFAWQESFGAFSYSYSHIGKVYNFIKVK